MKPGSGTGTAQTATPVPEQLTPSLSIPGKDVDAMHATYSTLNAQTGYAPVMAPLGTPRDVASTLDDAALYLEHHGWCRQDLYQHITDSPFPRACALGAVRLVIFGQPVEGDFYPGQDSPADSAHSRHVTAFLADYLNEYGGWPYDLPSGEIVTDWNDNRIHTGSEATATLRAAARRYREMRAA